LRRAAWVIVGTVALGAALAVALRWPRSVSLPTHGPAGPVWLFDFGPELAPGFANFAKVSARTLYDPERGWGWVDLEGDLALGAFHDPSLRWESTRNLNLILRAGPDELAASYANGPAAFGLDLEAGIYDVWVLSGDFGLLEYVPHEPFAIEVEGRRVAFAPPSAEEWIRRFETPGADDTIDDGEVYARYVAPRFRWEKAAVPVSDGQLTIRVLGERRDRSVLDRLGYYAFSDLKHGPPVRFTGALGAMIVTRSHPQSARWIERADELRRESFRRHGHRKPSTSAPGPAAAADVRRGYSLFRVSTDDEVLPHTIRPHETPSFDLRAARGESVPLTFAVRPHRELGTTQLRLGALRGPGGGEIGPSSLQVGAVRYVASPTNDGDRPLWEPGPGVIVPNDHCQLAAGVSKQIWLTLHVPEDATPGLYAGALDLRPEHGEPTSIPLELEVLPFRLRRPTHLATGLTYFLPVAYAALGEERFWSRVRADFADMRRHGMTTVQLTGMGVENHAGLDRLFAEYRSAGFEQPIYFLESYAAIEHIVDRYGHAQATEAFHAKYEEIFRRLLDEAQRRGWPPLIVNFGDEFTNSAREEFGAELARRLERIPGIVTAADANGYKEVSLLAPHVSILAFNRGWDGPTGVNRGKPLLNAGTVARIQAAGATPWLVNVGRDRFSSGLYFWKMARLGVRGKIEWIYSDYRAEPHNPFDGQGMAGDPLAYPGPRGTTLPTLPYERMRLGLDDLAYLHTLEEAARAAPPGLARDRAEALIERIDRMIDDDYTTRHGPEADRWSDERYRRLRDDVIEAIRQLPVER
jgi:hypothetical protein